MSSGLRVWELKKLRPAIPVKEAAVDVPNANKRKYDVDLGENALQR